MHSWQILSPILNALYTRLTVRLAMQKLSIFMTSYLTCYYLLSYESQPQKASASASA